MSRSQTNSVELAWDTLLDVDGPVVGDGFSTTGEGRARAGAALHVRLTTAIRDAVRAGRLPAGAALPPSRVLAGTLGCSRWVVTEAYGQLVAEGYLEARTGSATRVAGGRAVSENAVGTSGRQTPAGAAGPADPLRTPTRRLTYDLAAGVPDVRAFPRERWVDAVRAALATAPVTDLVAPVAVGHVRVRETIAGHVERTRAAVVAPADLTVTHGATDGMTRLCRALVAAGHRALGVEDPSWPRLRTAAQSVGLRVVPLPLDGEGLCVGALDDVPEVRAVLVTPAHQFPTGVVLSPRRREALLAWAHRVDGLVIEDDYDAEFRYDRRPVAALQGMDPHRVALLGSVSKTLTPGIGLGWLVTPPSWTGPVADTNPTVPAPAVVDQLALLELIRRGWYDRHLRAVRLIYRSRRDALLGALADELPGWRPSGTAAGLHFLLHLPEGATATGAGDVVRAAARREVAVSELSRYRLRPREPEAALVIGYGNLRDSAVRDAVRELAAAVRA